MIMEVDIMSNDRTISVYLLCVCIVSTVSEPAEYRFRLTLNTTENEGRVEVTDAEGHAFRTICDEGTFQENEARVICRNLGYSFGRSTPRVYSVKSAYSPIDFTLKCGPEVTQLSDCQILNRNVSTCSYTSSYYSGVCCSNNEAFGEFEDDLFISHCKATWWDAHTTCESRDYHMSSSRDLEDSDPEDRGVTTSWVGQFYSPWIWNDGCALLTRSSGRDHVLRVQNNSPQLCSQFCGYAKNSVFALRGTVCRCIQPDTTVTLMKPRNCDRLCHPLGNYQMCGSSARYWSLYTLADVESSFVSVTSPGANQTSQCAVIRNENGVRKLSENDCHEPHGYICREVLPDGTDGNLQLAERVEFSEARKRCYKFGLHLAGHHILDTDSKLISGYHGSFVNVERVLTSLYEYDDMNRTIFPTWCSYMSWKDDESRRHIIECKEQRHSFVCSKDKVADPVVVLPTFTEDPVQTNITANNTVPGGSSDKPSPRTHADSQDSVILEIALIGIGSAIVVVIVVIIVILCWKRVARKREKKRNSSVPDYRWLQKSTSSQSMPNRYQSYTPNSRLSDENTYYEIVESEMSANNSLVKPRPLPRPPEPQYFELIGGKEYLELQTLGSAPAAPSEGEGDTDPMLDQRDDNGLQGSSSGGGGNQPVTIKASYSFPNDEIKPAELTDEDGYLAPRSSAGSGYEVPYDNVGAKKTPASQSETQTVV